MALLQNLKACEISGIKQRLKKDFAMPGIIASKPAPKTETQWSVQNMERRAFGGLTRRQYINTQG